MFLSKTKIKFIRSLEHKKNRKAECAFLAEGNKLVGDLLGHFHCRLLVATSSWLSSHPDVEAEEIIEVSRDELTRASLMQTPQDVLAVFTQPEPTPILNSSLKNTLHSSLFTLHLNSLCLALDDVQDPGNLGTIVRIADWFGIRNIFCSHGTADIYNPKTVQATMGSIARVRLHYCDLPELLSSIEDTSSIFGTFLDGEDIYSSQLSPSGIIVMGNEGKGISPQVSALIPHRLLIPSFPHDAQTSESLNVAVATAIVCSEFRRRTL